MSRFLIALSAIVLLAGPVAAEVVASEVWEGWQRQANAAGMSLTADITRQQNLLILEQPVLEIGSGADRLELRLDRLTLRDNTDGSVSVVLPESFPITVGLPPSPVPTDPDVIVFTALAPGLEVTLSGLGTDTAFRVLAPSLSLALDPSTFPAGEVEALNLALADLFLDHQQSLAPERVQIETTLELGTLHLDGLVALGDDDRTSIAIDLSGVSGSAFVKVDPIPVHDGTATLPELLSGLSDTDLVHLTLEHGDLALDVTSVLDAPGPREVRLRSESASAFVRLDRTAFAGEVRSGETRLDAVIEDPEVPIRDIGVSYLNLAFGGTLGVTGPSDPLRYDAFARLNGLEFDGPIWDGFDPGKAFPRDPISTALALSGEVIDKPLTVPAGFGAPANVELLSLSLDEFGISGLGIGLTGEGALTFDNSDLVTYEGVPAPTGTLAFRASGINALLDRLIDTGLIPEENETALRLGLAFIAKPGEEADTLTSQVEFRDASLYLNGVKMR